MNRKGFTLVELLAVLVVLVIIALLAINSIKSTLQKADDTIDKDTEKQIINAAEKWAIENSERFDDTEGKKIQVGLDIVFIVDMSGSMHYDLDKGKNLYETKNYDYKNTRYAAAANAINEAIKVLKGSDINRASIVFYSNTISEYSDSKLKNINSVRTLTANNDAKQTISYNNGYKSGKIETLGATYTQLGVQEAESILESATNKQGRIPVIILLTDGEPTRGYPVNEKNPFEKYTSYLSNGMLPTTATTTSPEIMWTVMRTAYLAKNRLSNLYGAEAFFYTIGLGITSKYGAFMLEPNTTNLNAMKGSKTVVREQNKKSGITQVLEKDIYSYFSKITVPYDYPTQAFYGNFDASTLKSTFVDIATKVTEAAKVTEVCITTDDLYKEGYLSTNDIKLSNGNKVGEYIIMSMNEATNQYAFTIAKTEEQKAECKKYLVQSSK